MRIVFEGTANQIENLKDLLKGGYETDDFPTLREDYQTENLWSIVDVTGNYDCNDEDAMIVLEEAMQNNATIDQIWESIEVAADYNNIYRNGTPDINN